MNSKNEKDDDNQNKDSIKASDLWTEDENKYMVECLKKMVEDLQQFKSNHDGKLSEMEENLRNIKNSLYKLLIMSHKILKSTTKTMNMMVENLENSYQVKMVVFVDVEKEECQREGGGSSNKTRVNLKKKADQALVNIQ